MTNLIGVSNSGQPFQIRTWNGSSWAAKGTQFSGLVVSAVGMSPDGDTVALFNSNTNSIIVYDYTTDWFARSGTIALDVGTSITSKISISSDKNTISFSGTPNTSTKFGVWTWDGSTWTQDSVFYNKIVTDIDANAVLAPRAQAYALDKTLYAIPYTNTTNNYSGIAVYKPGPSGPLIVAVDDDFSAQSFNVHPNNQRLIASPPFSVLVNDTYTPPQVVQTGLVVGVGVNAEANFNSIGELFINADHLPGNFSFTYTVEDDNGMVSNSANVNYAVVNFGITGTLTSNNAIAGELTEILSAAKIHNLISDSSDLENILVEVSLASSDYPPRVFNANQMFGYSVLLNSLSLQTVIVSFTYMGETLNAVTGFSVVDPPKIRNYYPLFPPVPVTVPSNNTTILTNVATVGVVGVILVFLLFLIFF